jgi:hypothetical protein
MCSRSTSLSSSVCLARAGPVVALPGRGRRPLPAAGLAARLDREMQGIDLDDVTWGKNDRTLDDVLQLADVAWPRMALQSRLGRDAQPQARPTSARAVRCQKMARQRDDVLDPLPQCRDQQGKDVEPIEQVLAKQALRHGVGDVPIGRGNDADIEDHRFLATDPLHFALLKNAQQLGLQAKRHFGDLIEQQRAILRLLKLAGLRVLGATEGAFFMAEKRRFKQAVGNGRTVDGDERPLAPCRMLVNVACHHLLADPALAGQQDRRIGLRDPTCEAEEIAGDRIDGDDPAGIRAAPASDNASRVRAGLSVRRA